MPEIRAFITSLLFDLIAFKTERSAKIKSTKIGIVYRISQFLIVGYIIGWELIYLKSYQLVDDEILSVVSAKVKGQGFILEDSNFTNEQIKTLTENDPVFFKKKYGVDPNQRYKIIDTADYVIPPDDSNSLFIMTRFIKTVQNQNFCLNEREKISCQTSLIENCTDSMNEACRNQVWCPEENDLYRRNISPDITKKQISNCVYDDLNDPYCPVFKVETILKKAEPDLSERYKMLETGGVVELKIDWNCNYDLGTKCFPSYSFVRFDSNQVSSGFNFRFASKYKNYNVEERELYKAYGLKFILSVSGNGGEFSLVPLLMTIGSGLGLMSISVIVADCFMLHFIKERKLFKKVKKVLVDKHFSLIHMKPFN